MTDNLRDRIAEVLKRHRPDNAELQFVTCIGCGVRTHIQDPPNIQDWWEAHLADAVIRELGLEREHWQYGDGDTMGVRCRYVTHWEESNE